MSDKLPTAVLGKILNGTNKKEPRRGGEVTKKEDSLKMSIELAPILPYAELRATESCSLLD